MPSAPSSVERPCWRQRVENARRRIVRLSGPRRLGKTTLARSLPDVDDFACELPGVRRDADDTEAFLARHRGRRVVLDEIHRRRDPAGHLEVAADHFPDIRVPATGSSAPGASARFRDTLAGRKRSVPLPPVLLRELPAFGITSGPALLARQTAARNGLHPGPAGPGSGGDRVQMAGFPVRSGGSPGVRPALPAGRVLARAEDRPTWIRRVHAGVKVVGCGVCNLPDLMAAHLPSR